MSAATRSRLAAAALAGLAIAACDAAPVSDPTALAPGASERSDASAPPSGEALAAALSEPEPYARAARLGALLPTLGPEAVPAVRQALDEFRVDLGAVEFELLLRYWASHEPAEATAWTFKYASPLYRNAAVRVAVEVWAAADPASAVVAVQSAPAEANEEVARVAEVALVQGWFQKDRPGLESYIYGLGSGVDRQRALFAYLLSLIAEEGSEAAIRWSEAIPEEDQRYKFAVYRQAMSALAWADSPAAARFCDAHCDGPFGRGLRNVLIRTRLRNGDYGGDVVEWVARVPKGDEAQQANWRHSLWVAYATWAFQDREAAMAWMEKKTAGPEEPAPWVRRLYGEYARLLASESPEEAIKWAERVEDDAERKLTLVRIARFWRRQDEAAAEAWLAQSSLSEQAREQARNTKIPDHLPRRRDGS